MVFRINALDAIRTIFYLIILIIIFAYLIILFVYSFVLDKRSKKKGKK